MKRMKKFVSILLTVMMVLAAALPGFAAEETEKGSITIGNAVKEHTYSIYKLFDLESFSNDAYAYRIDDDSKWKSFIENYTDADGSKLFAIDAQGYVTWVGDKEKQEAQAKNLAIDALAYAKENNIESTASKEATEGSLKFENLELGYYLVDSSAGALCSLGTTDKDAKIEEKNEVPTVEKEVNEKDGDKDNWGENNDASIGDTIEYRTTIHVKKGAEKYILHDKMSAGLTFKDVTKVKNGEKTLEKDKDYSVETSSLADECTFHVIFTDEFLQGLNDDETIVVYYEAELNGDAEIKDEANPNNAKLEYGDGQETEEDVTNTFTWKFDVKKVDKNDHDKTLAGATFTLSKDTTGKPELHFVKDKDSNVYKVTPATASDEEKIYEITTDETGAFIIEGLDSGTYYLTETKAPDGYNVLDGPVKIEITSDGKVMQDGNETTEVTVENNTGSLLPETGGMGTTVLYILGGVLIVGAGAVLVLKKRGENR